MVAAAFACSPGQGGDAAQQAATTPDKLDDGAKTPGPGPDPSSDGDDGGLMALPEVIATVAGEPISRAAFEVRYQPSADAILARRDDGKVPLAYQAQQRRKLIESLTYAKQLELEAKRTGTDYDPEVLAKQEADERRHVLDWAAWVERVGQTEAVRHQANVVFVRERALFAARGTPIEASEAELRAAYEAAGERFQSERELVRASHILVTYGPRQGDERIQPVLAALKGEATAEQMAQWDALALARALELREAAMAPGVDFNALAKEYSEGPGAFRGGDMGLFPDRQMVPEYTAAVWPLAAGEITEPVKSDKGYYVIKCFGHYQPGELPFEAVRPDLVREVESAKYKQAKQALEAALDERFVVSSEVLDQALAFKNSR